MIIDIEVTNTSCKILNMLSKEQLEVIQDVCSFKVEGSEYKVQAFKNKRIDWDGNKRLFNIQTRRFPIGLLNLVVKTFNAAGIETKLVNKRKSLIPDPKSYIVSNFQDRGYQYSAVASSIMNGNGIIKAATGSGKTTIAARTIGALGGWSTFVVHTKDLLYQTKESFNRMFGCDIGQIGDGIIDYKPITVATMQSLAILGSLEFKSYKYDEEDDGYKERISLDIAKAAQFNEYRRNVNTIMFDEVQRICSQTAYAARFLFEYANYGFGYSASPWRDDGSDLMIEAAFGPRICDISASELIQQGYLVRPQIIIKKLGNNVWSGKTYEQVYKSAIVENIFRNMQIVQDADEQFNKYHRNTLVLVTQIKHGEILEKMFHDLGIGAIFISGQSRMKKRLSVLDDMRNGKAPIVISSTIADVGLDVPRLQSIVEAGAGKSSVTALQRLGRIMRPFEGKDQCYFITYRDTAPYLCNQIDKKITIWSMEKEFIITER